LKGPRRVSGGSRDRYHIDGANGDGFGWSARRNPRRPREMGRASVDCNERTVPDKTVLFLIAAASAEPRLEKVWRRKCWGSATIRIPLIS